MKGKLFRIAVDISDNIDIWISKTFNLQPKQRLLEIAQDTITRRHLQNTIGKAVGTSNITERRKRVAPVLTNEINFVTDKDKTK